MADRAYVPTKARVVRTVELTKDIHLLRLNTSVRSTPGQFLQVSVLGFGEAPFSIASHSEKHADLCVRVVGRLTHRISQLRRGDVIYIRGPYGNGYPINEFENKNIVIIAGGTGIAPLRALMEYIERHRQRFLDLHVYLGFRSPDQILFVEDIARWKNKFDVVLTVDGIPDGYRGRYEGEVGYLAPVIERHPVRSENAVAAVCGPPIMIKTTVQVLKKFGFRDDQIYISFERHMKCGLGQCGHCMINHKYVCTDGPVFRYDEIGELDEAGI